MGFPLLKVEGWANIKEFPFRAFINLHLLVIVSSNSISFWATYGFELVRQHHLRLCDEDPYKGLLAYFSPSFGANLVVDAPAA